MMRDDLTQTLSGMEDSSTAFIAVGPNSGADGGGDTAPPSLIKMATVNNFSASTLTDAASSAAHSVADTVGSVASSVSTTASSAASSVSSAVSGAWAKLTGKSSTPTVSLPVVSVTGAKVSVPSTSSSQPVWLWVLLAAGVAYLVYHFTGGKKGRKGSKLFSSFRASGSHVKPYGK